MLWKFHKASYSAHTNGRAGTFDLTGLAKEFWTGGSMMPAKRPTKSTLSKAARTLRSENASAKEKSTAGKILSQHSFMVAPVHYGPKKATLGRTTVKRIVDDVVSKSRGKK